ncbi:MAG: InlB B-repeat-containing protein, partial [Eubacterium sp.]|nr:InlB B-repeat-containing protein [Eubacterium sp.]
MKKTAQKFMAVLVSILMVLSSGAVDLRLDARVANRGAYVTAEAAEEDLVGDPDEAAEPVVEQIPEAEEPEEQPPVEQPAEEAAPAEPETIVDTPDSGKAQNDVQPIDKDETPADKGEAGTIKEEKEEPELPTIVQPDKAPEKVNDKADDPKDDKEDEKPEEVKMPAFSDSATTAGGITVSVSAPEGVFPEGTVLRVADVSSAYAENVYDNMIPDDRQVSDARAVDITFYDKDGNEIEPLNSVVHVSMSLPTSIGGDDFSVLHQTDAGAIETVTKNASSNGASFLASSFSVYVIIGTDPVPENETEVPRITYIFYSNETVVDTQIIKNSPSESDEVKEPAVPELDGYEFAGWTTEQNADADSFTRFQFGHQNIASYTEDTTIPVYAVYREAPKYQVIFMNGVGTDARIAQIKRAKSGDTVTFEDVILPLDSVHSVVAWCKDQALQQPVASVTVGTEDITLYPNIQEGHYIYFESDGGSYVKPSFVAANTNTVAPTDPHRPGYTFDKWVVKGSSTEFRFGRKLTEDITLTAQWKKDKAKYTIIYWKQSLNDRVDAADSAKTYDYAGSKSVEDTTEKEVKSQGAPQLTDAELKGFNLNTTKIETIHIKGDGTSILNVYYDRKVITINFYYNKQKTRLYKTLKGLYRQPIAVWPETSEVGQSKARWCYYEDYNPWSGQTATSIVTFLGSYVLDSYDNTEKLDLWPYSGDYNCIIRHYKQDSNGNWTNTPETTLSAYTGTFEFSNKYTGFQVYQYRMKSKGDADFGSWMTATVGGKVKIGQGYNEAYELEIRHKREEYPLSYYNHNEIAKTENVLYEKSLNRTEYKDYVPPKPSDLADYDVEFRGWYKDEAFTQLFDFNITMPPNGIEIYAKWS